MQELHVPVYDAKGIEIKPRVPTESERCVLFVRTYRSRWRPPQSLSYVDSTSISRTFVLVSAFIGSEWCGHQVSINRSCERDVWAFSDSDAIRMGISPICFHIPSNSVWHSEVTLAIPYSNASATNEFCDLSPSQRHPRQVVKDHLNALSMTSVLSMDTSSTEHDFVNVDYIYLSV